VLEFFVWFFLFLLLGAGLLFLDEWLMLFQSRNTYEKHELLDYRTILIRKLNQIFLDPIPSLTAFLTGILLAWFFVWIGGLPAPDATEAVDWAEDSWSNYFFQSAIMVFMLHFIWPALEDVKAGEFLSHYFQATIPLFSGLGLSLVSVQITSWGVHHNISFLFMLINSLLILAYLRYRLSKLHTKEEPAIDPFEDDVEIQQTDFPADDELDI
jgi:hypothetical protein